MKIAFIDLETTGLDPAKHEIIEIGVVVYDTVYHTISHEQNYRIAPKRIEEADPIALKVNGYNEKEWSDAVTLEAAFAILEPVWKGTYFCAFNNTFDWGFMQATGINLPFQIYRLDVLSMAWLGVPHHRVKSWSLKNVCTALGVPPEPAVHRALNGAKNACLVYQKLTRA